MIRRRRLMCPRLGVGQPQNDLRPRPSVSAREFVKANQLVQVYRFTGRRPIVLIDRAKSNEPITVITFKRLIITRLGCRKKSVLIEKEKCCANAMATIFSFGSIWQ